MNRDSTIGKKANLAGKVYIDCEIPIGYSDDPGSDHTITIAKYLLWSGRVVTMNWKSLGPRGI